MRVNPEPAPTAGTGWNIQTCGRKVFPAIVGVTIEVLVMTAAPATAEQLTPAEARAIAKEATIYGFPLVDNYRVQYSYFVDRGGDQFKAPWNTLVNNARVYTPADTAIQTPNSDTPYSFARRGPARRAAGAHRAGDRARIVTTRSSSSTCTRSTSPMSAAGRRATTPAISSSPGRTGMAKRRRA